MQAYLDLAYSYDRLTNDVDYGAVVEFYMQILAREGLTPRTAVDLACGTGSVALLLAQKGLQVTAVDMSEDMLCRAAQKAQEARMSVTFACQRLEQLHLPKAVDLAVCALDSLDYITDPEACAEAIRRVYKALNPGGIFIFDVNTPYKHREILRDNVFVYEFEDLFCCWQNSCEDGVNVDISLDIFAKEEGESGWDQIGRAHV